MLSAAIGFDVDMVREYIEAHGLDPVSRSEPEIVKSGSVRVTVERYSWGGVYFAEDRGYGLSLTWVERGEKRPKLPVWAATARGFMKRPECLGHHEKDHVCDGGVNPENGERERACAWKARCLIVQAIAGKPENVESTLSQFTDAELAERADTKGRKKRAPSLAAQRERKRRSAKTYANSVEIVHAFIARMMELGGWELAKSRFRASANQFFLREYERKGRGNYFCLFRRIPDAKNDDGRAFVTSLVMLYPHSSALRFSMQIRSGQLDFVRGVMPEHIQVRAGHNSGDHGAIVSVNRIVPEDLEDVTSGLVQVIQEKKYDAPGSWPAIGAGAPRIWTRHSIIRGKR